MGEWNDRQRGYFRSGPPRNEWERQGQEQRDRDDQARRDLARRQSETRPVLFQQTGSVSMPTYTPPSARRGGSSAPLTFGSSAKGLAGTGAILAAMFGFITLGSGHLSTVAMWTAGGAVCGAIAGVALYVTIVLLRIALIVLGWLLAALVVFWLVRAFL